jgi:hypothetical protein
VGKRLILSLCCSLFVLSMGLTAAAGATTDVAGSSYSVVVLRCGSFDVVQSADVKSVATGYQDGDSLVHSNSAITYTNSVTGASLTGRAAVNYKYAADATEQVGLDLRIVIPGSGAEVLETGILRTVDNQVVFEAGTFDSSIDLCAALS